MAKRSAKSKKPAKKRRKPGRPALKINLDDLGKLAGLQCTRVEAAAFFGCSEETIKRRLTQEKYREVWEAGKAGGRMSLRRSQFRLAETNSTMAIWLGKQYLGQRDKAADRQLIAMVNVNDMTETQLMAFLGLEGMAEEEIAQQLRGIVGAKATSGSGNGSG